MGNELGRRHLLGTLVKWIFGLTALSWVPPAALYLFPKSRGEAEKAFLNAKGEPIKVSAVLKTGSVVGLALGHPVIVVDYQGKLNAFSAVCPHLGCLVQWQKQTATFLCPCHAGKFDANGNVISGPPPKGLENYLVKVVANEIQLSEA